MPALLLAACATEPAVPPDRGVALVAVSAGVSGTCAVSAAAALYCWGRLSWGPSEDVRPAKYRDAGTTRAIDLSADAFQDFGCVTSAQDVVECWGFLRRGSDHYAEFSNTPRLLPAFPHVSAVAVSNTHVCAVRLDDTALCSLGFLSGVGGTGDTVSDLYDSLPRPVHGGIAFRELVAGDWMTCGLAVVNRLVYCWGRDTEVGVSDPPADQADSTCWAWPCVNRPLPIASSLHFEHLTAGEEHVCALGAAGVYCWGHNDFGQTGQPGSLGAVTTIPTRVPLSGIARISAGRYHTCALRHGGEAFCWGWNNSGQLGRTTVNEADAHPSRVETSIRFEDISAGGWHSCAIGLDKQAYCWGWNARGQLGTGDSTAVTSIVRVRLE